MKTAEHIIETVDKLVRKYHTRDPYELCQLLGIKIHYYDLQKKLKGFFYYQSRQKNIVIDHNVNGILERILVAHELGHAVLHTKIAMMHGFQEMEVFDDRSIEENEANFFAAELLLEDGEVLECLSEHTFFETAKMLYVPAALLDYKFSLLHEKGELINSMYIRKADFLKEDLHAYDNDITKCSRQYSCIICGYISVGTSLGRARMNRLASCEFHCFSTSSTAFQSVARSAYSGGAFAGNMISV